MDFKVLKQNKDKLRVKAKALTEEVLNPYSEVKLRFLVDGKVLHEADMLLKCEQLEGLSICFSKDFTVLSLGIGRDKLNVPIEWEGCLTWEGRPILESQFFERGKVQNGYFLGQRKNYTCMVRIDRLEHWEAPAVSRVVVNGEEYFCKRFRVY